MNKVIARYSKQMRLTSPSFLKTSAASFSRRSPRGESPLEKITKLIDGQTSQSSKKDSDCNTPPTVSRRLNADSKTIGKLRQSLVAKTKGVLDIQSQGRLEATCEDVLDVMNETLASSALINVFKGVKDASMVIEIAHVDMNMDYSHAYAHWESELLTKFVDSVRKERGQEDAMALAVKMESKITSKLQKLEPVFRTKIIKKMEFKRVPRIFFKCVDPLFESLVSKEKEMSMGASAFNLLHRSDGRTTQNED